jgi:glycosyltransferase involved in cell wall biosynthesis
VRPSTDEPTVSILLPVHDEARILAGQTRALLAGLRERGFSFELLLIENGSHDGSAEVCRALAAESPEVRVVSLPVGDYGLALRAGIEAARMQAVVVFNVDFWSLDFLERSLVQLRTATLVVGSKAAAGAHDQRPLSRRLVTRAYNRVLRLLWGFEGTDTHGMKAFLREPMLPLAAQCSTRHFIFDTELVLRAQRAGLQRVELPTDVEELRAPSWKSLSRRVNPVLRNLLALLLVVPPGNPRSRR